MTVKEDFLGIRHEEGGWAGFLDGVVFLREGGSSVLYHGNSRRVIDKGELA